MSNEVRQGSESAFAKAEYEQRTARARKLLAEAGIDVMVVTGPENIFYLTGQQTPGYYTFQALVLPVEGEPAFVIRQLEYFNFIANTFIANAEVACLSIVTVDVQLNSASRHIPKGSNRRHGKPAAHPEVCKLNTTS